MQNEHQSSFPYPTSTIQDTVKSAGNRAWNWIPFTGSTLGKQTGNKKKCKIFLILFLDELLPRMFLKPRKTILRPANKQPSSVVPLKTTSHNRFNEPKLCAQQPYSCNIVNFMKWKSTQSQSHTCGMWGRWWWHSWSWSLWLLLLNCLVSVSARVLHSLHHGWGWSRHHVWTHTWTEVQMQWPIINKWPRNTKPLILIYLK